MKKTLLALLFLLLLTLPVFGQDDTPSPTDEVAVTSEPTEGLPVATVTESDFITPTEPATATPNEVTSTPENTPIVIIVTPPPVEPPAEPTGGSAFANVGWVAFLFTLSALAFVVVTWIRELRKSAAAGDQNSKNLLTFVTATQNMLPVDQFLALIDQVEKRAKATPIPGEIDDKIAAQIKAAVYEALGRELPPEFPGAPAGN
jgi:hypothetical protein